MPKTKIIIGICVAICSIIAIITYTANQPKRYAVFAGYNADNTIHPYVLTYLKGLNEVTDGVVYIADSKLNPEEYDKLKGLVIHTEHKRHNEYDFGSYKRGFNWLKENDYLKKADELIFANDSCYAPLKSFKPMFNEMAKRKELDFWGNTQNTRFNQHLQSYFLVFRKRLFTTPLFNTFINNTKHQKTHTEYIAEYELKLTPLFTNNGYKWDSYQPYTKPVTPTSPDLNSFPLTLIAKRNNQFLKRRILTGTRLIEESEDKLLRYIYENYPKRYKEIAPEIPEWIIPDELKGKEHD